jgi:hypothetical protein
VKPRLVFLYGPPAVGKLTVARAVAERSSLRVLHNHVTIDAVAQVLPFGTPTFWGAVERLRTDLLECAAREGIDLVYTYVFAPGDEPHVAQAVDAYEAVGGSVLFVQLVASPDELLRRVVDPGRRAHGKIADVETLRNLLREHDLLAAITGRESLTIDAETLQPAAAADTIIEALESRE